MEKFKVEETQGTDIKIVFVKHPISPQAKRALKAKFDKIVDLKFAPPPGQLGDNMTIVELDDPFDPRKPKTHEVEAVSIDADEAARLDAEEAAAAAQAEADAAAAAKAAADAAEKAAAAAAKAADKKTAAKPAGTKGTKTAAADPAKEKAAAAKAAAAAAKA